MSQIVGQHEAETRKEIQANQRAAFRAKVFGKVRIVILLLFIATIIVVGFNYQDQLAKLFSSKPATEPTGQVANTLQGAQQNAAARDAVVNEVGK
jgi:hypothetical protein